MSNKLPNFLIPIECADKKNVEKWHKTRDMLNFPAPFRMVLCGAPSSGKSCFIKNVLIRAKPEFEQIFLFHYDKDGTEEWNDLDVESLDELPDPLELDNECKKCLIIEDMDLSMLDKESKNKLNRLFGYASSHKNLSIFLTAQDVFNIPTCARRQANAFILWKSPDVCAMSTMASRTGLKSKHLLDIFEQYLKKQHDSLTIDLTKDSPYPLRINGYNVITKK